MTLLDEIKVEIRSLLISSQNGLSEDELCRDYALFNSQRSLPYHALGFSSVHDLINSLTDVIYRSSNGQLHAIADSSTEHIWKFVQEQRSIKSSKSRPKMKKKTKKQKQSIDSQWQWGNKGENCRRVSSWVPPYNDSYRRKKHFTAGADFHHPLMTPTKKVKIKEEDSPFSTSHDASPKFERIQVTNELLQRLLIHFRRQQERQ